MTYLRPTWMLVLGLLSATAAGAEAPAALTDEALTTLYTKKLSAKPDPKCTLRSTVFPGLVQLGRVAPDQGCRIDLVLLDGAPLDPRTGERDIVERGGWHKLDPAGKEKLAWDYVREVSGDEPLKVEPRAFKAMKKKFEMPSATQHPDGGLTVRFWEAVTKGKSPVARYKLVEQSFAMDGTPAEEKAREGFVAHP
jgi:hypothetical protein